MQLDFDLTRPAATPATPEPKILTVTEVTRAIRSLIEDKVGEVWIEGEVSNLRKQASGHQYFTLKDSGAQIACVLFGRDAAQMRGLQLTDGQHVQAFGQVSVYEARGQYQLIVRLVQKRGEGALQAKFEALKQKLAAEGLFETARKRALPRFPGSVGVVTSPTGAALRDFLNVLHRRHPGIDVVINPVRVQGTGAANEIARAIREFAGANGEFGGAEGVPAVEVIVVTRGGGSIEDLWEFNEEIVARAIAESPVPVVSAIGHEIDFTIADFVADLRAPTPSAAAEILAADRLEVLAWLRQQGGRLTHVAQSRLDVLRAHWRALATSGVFREPERQVAERRQTLDRAVEHLARLSETTLERGRNALHRLAARIEQQSPAEAISRVRLQARLLGQKLEEVAVRETTARRARLERAMGVLNALSPEGTLDRGYTITFDEAGKPVTEAKKVKAGEKLKTRFKDGEVESVAGAQLTPPSGKGRKSGT